MTSSGRRYLAGALALLVAGIHLYWGFPRLVVYVQAGMMPDPRPLLFVASAIAILLGIARVLDGSDPDRIYLAGIGLMLGYIAGYALWHTGLAHGAFWPWGPEPISHDESALLVVADHLLADRLAQVSKLAEALLAAVLFMLYREEETAADERVPAVVRGDD